MANEITMTAKLKLANGELVVPEMSVIGKAIDQATQGYAGDVQATATAFALLTPPSLANPGWSYFKNLDATDTIYLGSANNEYTVELKPGESALFRCAVPLGAESTANAPLLQYVIFED